MFGGAVLPEPGTVGRSAMLWNVGFVRSSTAPYECCRAIEPSIVCCPLIFISTLVDAGDAFP